MRNFLRLLGLLLLIGGVVEFFCILPGKLSFLDHRAFSQNTGHGDLDSIIFNAVPEKRDGKKLSKAQAAEYGLLIKKRGDKYIWASRQDKLLFRSISGIFEIFTAVDGSGIVVVSDRTPVKSLLDPKDPMIVYAEHVRNGLDFISYSGSAEFFNP